jgi:hypothetical protein
MKRALCFYTASYTVLYLPTSIFLNHYPETTVKEYFYSNISAFCEIVVLNKDPHRFKLLFWIPFEWIPFARAL